MDTQRIREIFARHPGTAYQLAGQIGVPRSLISMILSGDRLGIRGDSKRAAEAVEAKAAELLAEERRGKGR
jgi:hypothetical protein